MSQRVTVYFYVWGKLSRTRFAHISYALKWLHICYDKGFLEPRDFRNPEGEILMDTDALLDYCNDRKDD